MDSKLPKPSSLRKAAVRSNVPSDRMMSVGPGFQITSKLATSGAKPSQSRTILTQNFENVCNALAAPRVKQVKLRRSMSLNDLNSIVNVRKRPAEPLFGGPAKTRCNMPPPRPVPSAAVRKDNVKIAPKLSNATKVASTGAVAKTAASNCRVSKFDFKTRFENLLEKHKALKAKHDTQQEQMVEFEKLPELYEKSREEISRLEAEMTEVKDENIRLEKDDRENKRQIGDLSAKLDSTTKEYKECLAEKENLLTKTGSMDKELTALKAENERLKSSNAKLTQDMEEYGEALFRFNIERKELHNTIMDLRGNIRVFCRVRPPLASEMSRALCSWQYTDESSLEISK